MAYKPFPMLSPASRSKWNDPPSIPKVKHANFPVSGAFRPGVSMRAHIGGQSIIPVNRSLLAPEPMKRKQLSPQQINAAHCKFLELQSWDIKRISVFLDLKYGFVYRVLAMLTYREVAPMRPPNFKEDSNA